MWFQAQKGGFILSAVPEVVDVINSPGIIKACNELVAICSPVSIVSSTVLACISRLILVPFCQVGEGWAIVPFCHHATFASGGRDQHWHKDDNGPYLLRTILH